MMQELYDLKAMLVKELTEYGARPLSAGSLDVIDRLAHATKNLIKVIDCEEGDSDKRGRFRHKLNALMDEAPSDEIRMELRNIMSSMETM